MPGIVIIYMYCNQFRCEQAGYCLCSDPMPEIVGNSAGCLITAIKAVFTLFLTPARRIRHAPMKFAPSVRAGIPAGHHSSEDVPLFSGTVWLIASPLFGLLSSAIYGMLFNIGAYGVIGVFGGSAQADKGFLVIVGTIFQIGTLLTCGLAVILAVIAYWRTNESTFKGALQGSTFRRVKYVLTCVIFGVYVLAALFFVAAPVILATSGYMKYNYINNLPPTPAAADDASPRERQLAPKKTNTNRSANGSNSKRTANVSNKKNPR